MSTPIFEARHRADSIAILGLTLLLAASASFAQGGCIGSRGTCTEFGVNGAFQPTHDFPPDRFVEKLQMIGAVWDRWPARWYWVQRPWEGQEGDFGFQGTFILDSVNDTFDITGAADANDGRLATLAVLDGVPRMYDCTAEYRDPANTDRSEYERFTRCDPDSAPFPRIEGLFEPNIPGNRWANYVHEVTEYLTDREVEYFELWNEPNLQWKDGDDNDPGVGGDERWVNDYVRMVEVSLAHASADAHLVLGANASPGMEEEYQQGGWIYNAWTGVRNAGLVDDLQAIGLHSYNWPVRTWTLAGYARAVFGDEVSLWVTESGIERNVNSDDPKFEDDVRFHQRLSSYLLQNIAYARVARVELVMHFAVHEGHLTVLDRDGNENSAGVAFRLATEHLGDAVIDPSRSIMPQNSSRPTYETFIANNDYTHLVFNKPDGTSRRVHVLWSNVRDADGATAGITLDDGQCLEGLLNQNGDDVRDLLRPAGRNQYRLELPGAYTWDANLSPEEAGPVFALVGGPTFLFFEMACDESQKPVPPGRPKPAPPPNRRMSPDLTPTPIEVDTFDIFAGQLVFFDSGITNRGEEDSGSFAVRWLVDGQDIRAVGGHEGVPAGETVPDGNSQLFWEAVAGEHTISFEVDAFNTVVESNENNNRRQLTVIVTEVELPDLVPTDIVVDSALVEGEEYLVDSGVANLGDADTGVFNVEWTVDGQSFSAAGSHAGVSAGDVVLDGNSELRWTAVGGTHTLAFTVDFDEQIEEIDETNNEVSVLVDVEGAPRITNKAFTPRLVPGGLAYAHTLEVEDPNDGDVSDFSLPQGPAGMAIDDAGTITWTAFASGIGRVFPVTAEVGDGLFTDSHAFDVQTVHTLFFFTEPQPLGSVFTVFNRIDSTGTANLLIGSVSLTGPNAGDEIRVLDDQCSGATLPPGTSCFIFLTIEPTAIGTKAATVVIPSNAVSFPVLYVGWTLDVVESVSSSLATGGIDRAGGELSLSAECGGADGAEACLTAEGGLSE